MKKQYVERRGGLGKPVRSTWCLLLLHLHRFFSKGITRAALSD